MNFKIEETKKSSNNRSYLILAIVLLVIAIGLIIYYFINNRNYISKKDNSKDYIYTVKKVKNQFQDNEYMNVPTINLEGKVFDNLNKAILDGFEELTDSVEYDYNYEFSKSKNILSLMIEYGYFTEGSDYPERVFETFNIDLRDGHFLTNDEILKKYRLTSKEVNNYLESKFNGFYKDLIAGDFYTEKECNYDCFLKNRGISSNYLENANYYIDNGSLTLFKYFKPYSAYEEEQYFYEENYQFVVKE